MTSDLPSVLTLADARSRGFSSQAVKYRVASGRWQRVFPRVYLTYNGPISDEHRIRAALAYAGAGAALSHQTAAVRHRLRVEAVTSIHLVVPAARRISPQKRLTIHYSRDLPLGDVRSVGGLACTSVERTVLDLVRASPSAGRAAGVLADAVASGRTTSARLRVLVRERHYVPYREDLLDVLTETEAGARSALELRHGLVCRTHGLPIGTRQLRELFGGRVTYADDLLEEYGIVTEMDGRLGHELAYDRFRDQQRDNANTVIGRSVLRFGWTAALDEPCEVARRRAWLLRSRGWRGTPTPCSPRCPVNEPFASLEDALSYDEPRAADRHTEGQANRATA
jgi:hypothetical protein